MFLWHRFHLLIFDYATSFPIRNQKWFTFSKQWNSHGYDIAKTFGNKFSFVSPVWLQVKRRPSGAYVVQGDHDIDRGKNHLANCFLTSLLLSLFSFIFIKYLNLKNWFEAQRLGYITIIIIPVIYSVCQKLWNILLNPYCYVFSCESLNLFSQLLYSVLS